MTCTRCDGTGFLNLFQVDDETRKRFDAAGDHQVIVTWMKTQTEPHDVSVCDCCGNREDWHGLPGHHYETTGDRAGREGPYGYNGGLAECN